MVPMAFAIILFGVTSFIEFREPLSPVEQQVLNFEYRQLKIEEIPAAVPADILKGLFDPPPIEQVYEKPERSDMTVTTVDLEVSLIIVSGDSRMAMIDGRLVKEGDIIDDTRVVKIESNRVLLNNKGNKWIYVKE